MKSIHGIFVATTIFLGSFFTAHAASMIPVNERYQMGQQIRVLIVPGHDNEFSGANADGMREAAVNAKLAGYLADELRKDPKLTVTVSRDPATGEYIPEIAEYFADNEDEVEDFITDHKKAFARKQRKLAREAGDDAEEPAQVPHGNATETVAYRLYAVNKWANEQAFDVILHIHFNDTWPRGGAGGQYGGYSIYVPGHGLQNEYPSNMVAGAIGARLRDIVAKTNLGLEAQLASDMGVIPDNKLIALGSYDTLVIPSILVEYSYVYEPHVAYPLWDTTLPAMARATTLGLQDYLNGVRSTAQTFSYQWNADLAPDTKTMKSDVVALQMALRTMGLYPPAGKTNSDCPMTGFYGPCTKSAVAALQGQHNLGSGGMFGPKTRAIMNRLFAR